MLIFLNLSHLLRLYVNWNPETIAAVQKSMQLSAKEKGVITHINSNVAKPNKSLSFEEDMVFFDTVESVETCSLNKDRSFLSEVSLESNVCSPKKSSNMDSLPEQLLSPLVIKAVTAMGAQYSKTDRDFLGQLEVGNHDPSTSFEDAAVHPLPHSILKVTFQLSKLRIQFNKESRHRRLITCEMCQLSVRYGKL